jgi:hypothetical protein
MVPDHMNLLSCPEALEHVRSCSVNVNTRLTDFPPATQLNKNAWEIEALKDRTMLPLGLDPFDLL